MHIVHLLIESEETRVLEPACFGAAPEIFYLEPAPAPGKRENNF